ncbi:MAG: hypothetical protein MUO92_00265 [Dehalococcoidales bacterium]|nr:hypothetical protein [Dehalococcoidales bacterium]
MNNNEDMKTRQERRQKRLEKKKECIPKHGRNLVKIYRDAILKRLRGKGNSKKP